MAIHVGRWDCRQCGHIGIMGPETKCINCDAPRPKGVRYYLPGDAQIVTNEEEIKKAKAGADWRCSFCETNNKAYNVACTSCGNLRTASDKKLEAREYMLNEVPTNSNKAKSLMTQDKVNGRYPTNTETKSAFKATNKLLWWSLGLSGFVIFVLIFLLSIKHKITVDVVQMHWEREISTEEYRAVTEEDWRVPSGGTEISSHQAIHHYIDIPDGYENKTRTVQVKVGDEQYVCGKRDMGNGYFEDKYCSRPIYDSRTETYQEKKYRKEPVYQTRYKYSIYRWRPGGSIKTSGNDKNAQWGDASGLQNNAYRRENGRKETYLVYVMDEKQKEQKNKVSFGTWGKINIGDKILAYRDALGKYRGLAER